MTNFRTMNDESIRTLNYINSALEANKLKLLLLSTDYSIDLNCQVISIPFSLNEYGQRYVSGNSDQEFNPDFLPIDSEFNGFNEINPESYKRGINSLISYTHNLVRKIKPCAGLFWSGTVPQSVLMKNIFDTYFIPTFYIERGFLPETLMIDVTGHGSYSFLNHQKDINNFMHNSVYEILKEYYLKNKFEKHKQNEWLPADSLRNKYNVRQENLIVFIGQWDVASGVSSCGNLQSHISSPFYNSTHEMFCALKEAVEHTNHSLVFKPHPYDKNVYQSKEDKNIFVDKKANLHSLFQAADIIVGANTTALYEAIFYEKPIILLGNTLLNHSSGCYTIDSRNDLKEAINDASEKIDFVNKINNNSKFLEKICEAYLFAIADTNPITTHLPDLIRRLIKNFHLDKLNGVDDDKLEQMVAAFELHIRLTDKSSSRSELEKAEQLIEEGNLSKAKELLLQMLKQDCRDVDVINDLAVVGIMDKEYEKAKKFLKKALHINPKNEVSLGNMNYLEQQTIILQVEKVAWIKKKN